MLIGVQVPLTKQNEIMANVPEHVAKLVTNQKWQDIVEQPDFPKVLNNLVVTLDDIQTATNQYLLMLVNNASKMLVLLGVADQSFDFEPLFMETDSVEFKVTIRNWAANVKRQLQPVLDTFQDGVKHMTEISIAVWEQQTKAVSVEMGFMIMMYQSMVHNQVDETIQKRVFIDFAAAYAAQLTKLDVDVDISSNAIVKLNNLDVWLVTHIEWLSSALTKAPLISVHPFVSRLIVASPHLNTLFDSFVDEISTQLWATRDTHSDWMRSAAESIDTVGMKEALETYDHVMANMADIVSEQFDPEDVAVLQGAMTDLYYGQTPSDMPGLSKTLRKRLGYDLGTLVTLYVDTCNLIRIESVKYVADLAKIGLNNGDDEDQTPEDVQRELEKRQRTLEERLAQLQQNIITFETVIQNFKQRISQEQIAIFDAAYVQLKETITEKQVELVGMSFAELATFHRERALENAVLSKIKAEKEMFSLRQKAEEMQVILEKKARILRQEQKRDLFARSLQVLLWVSVGGSCFYTLYVNGMIPFTEAHTAAVAEEAAKTWFKSGEYGERWFGARAYDWVHKKLQNTGFIKFDVARVFSLTEWRDALRSLDYPALANLGILGGGISRLTYYAFNILQPLISGATWSVADGLFLHRFSESWAQHMAGFKENAREQLRLSAKVAGEMMFAMAEQQSALASISSTLLIEFASNPTPRNLLTLRKLNTGGDIAGYQKLPAFRDFAQPVSPEEAIENVKTTAASADSTALSTNVRQISDKGKEEEVEINEEEEEEEEEFDPRKAYLQLEYNK